MNRTLNDADDDFELPQRASDRRSAAHNEVYRDERAPDRELTLSTGTVLGLFFALALICAVFFGFGYTMGRKSGQAAADTAAAAATTNDNASTDTTASKPAAGSPAIQAIPGYLSQHDADAANRSAATQGFKPSATVGSNRNNGAANGATTVTIPVSGSGTGTSGTGTSGTSTSGTSLSGTGAFGTGSGDAAAMAHKRTTDTATASRPQPALTKPAPTGTTSTGTNSTGATSATSTGTAPFNAAAAANGAAGPMYVQIAAVSHKEDADNLLAALKRRGYSAFERNLDTDKLIHVQVGPFNSKQSAEAMRGRLLGDSYNAILK